MSMLVWTLALVCWSLATLLVASLATQSLGGATRGAKKTLGRYIILNNFKHNLLNANPTGIFDEAGR